MTKKNYLQDRFFVSKRNFTTKHIKIVQNSRFFKDIRSKFQVSRFFGHPVLKAKGGG